MLDLTLSDPALLSGTAQPWRDAGYTVEYRRFYPHLTRADLGRYRTVLFLLGREPEQPSDAASPSDLAFLTEWVRKGGVVVLAYAAGAGSLDRWSANEWLASRGAGIVIDDRVLEDTSVRPPGPGGRPWALSRPVGDDPLGSVYDSFPLAENHLIHVAHVSQTLATTSGRVVVRAGRNIELHAEAPVAAAARLGDGLVVVVSRDALGVLAPAARSATLTPLETGALATTRDFLTALARWTRRPAEWAHVPPGGRARAVTLANAPLPLVPLAAPGAPPPTVDTVRLPETFAPKAARPADLPSWIRQAGIRALWTPLLTIRLDSIVPWLDQAGINLFGGDARPEIVGDSAHHGWDERDAVRRAWKQTTNLLQPTSVAWIPAFDLADYRPVVAWTDSSRGPRGEAIAVPCALDSLYWDGGVVPAYLALARLAGQTRPLVPALALDFVPARAAQPSAHSMGQEFCDHAWHVALMRLGWRGPLEAVPASDRYRTLLEAGLLPLYFKALEDIVAARAQVLRERVLKEHAGLYFAFRLPQLPGDWFTLGLLRGFSMPDRPLLLLTPEVQTGDVLAAYRARGLNAVHAVELPLALVRPGALPRLKAAVFAGNDGFWLPGLPAPARAATERLRNDSVGRLLRRLAR
ncbi:MAG TPA: hypothetical protein VLV16_09925 [Gemmatimonadales bacterium]|nr:hypothetical protein [Gemmatimonadales bacterium]